MPISSVNEYNVEKKRLAEGIRATKVKYEQNIKPHMAAYNAKTLSAEERKELKERLREYNVEKGELQKAKDDLEKWKSANPPGMHTIRLQNHQTKQRVIR